MASTAKQPSRSAAANVRHTFEGELAHALSLVQREAALGDDAVHEIRREMKRARAALRLLRDAVPQAEYQRENARLRDAARPLAQARDERVMLDTIDALLANKKMRPHRSALRRLRSQLRGERAARGGRKQTAAVARELGTRLEESAERIRRWQLPGEGTPIIPSGLLRIYRKGRRALRQARRQSSDSALHELRKQVKYLQSAMETATHAGQRGVKKKEAKRAVALADRLGADHDLAVLSTAIRARGAEAALLQTLGKKRKKLQRKAIKRARRLYATKSKAFAARLR